LKRITLLPQGVEALEAALDKKRLEKTRAWFEERDKNEDGNISHEEVPPAQFQTPVWLKANLNGDNNLSWEEELIWQYNAQNREKQKEPRAKKSSTRTE